VILMLVLLLLAAAAAAAAAVAAFSLPSKLLCHRGAWLRHCCCIPLLLLLNSLLVSAAGSTIACAQHLRLMMFRSGSSCSQYASAMTCILVLLVTCNYVKEVGWH
jgi:hypothetical protein